MRIENYAIYPLFMAESWKFPRLVGNRVREHDVGVRLHTGSRNKAVSRMRIKICNRTLIYGRIAEIPASCRKSGGGTRW